MADKLSLRSLKSQLDAMESCLRDVGILELDKGVYLSRDEIKDLTDGLVCDVRDVRTKLDCVVSMVESRGRSDDGLDERLKEFDSALGSFRAQFSALTSSATIHAEDVQAVKRDLFRLSEMLDSFDKKLDDSSEEVMGLRDVADGLSRRVVSAEDREKAREKEIQELRIRMEDVFARMKVREVADSRFRQSMRRERNLLGVCIGLAVGFALVAVTLAFALW